MSPSTRFCSLISSPAFLFVELRTFYHSTIDSNYKSYQSLLFLVILSGLIKVYCIEDSRYNVTFQRTGKTLSPACPVFRTIGKERSKLSTLSRAYVPIFQLSFLMARSRSILFYGKIELKNYNLPFFTAFFDLTHCFFRVDHLLCLLFSFSNRITLCE